MYLFFPKLPLPQGVTESQLFNFITSVRVDNAHEEEMRNYGTQDFKRFVYTWGLTQNIEGKCLELGANPYFTTMLLKKYSDLELTLANYFETYENGKFNQGVFYKTPTGVEHTNFDFVNFNVETDPFPFDTDTFNLVIFAEIIEHLLKDPCKVLREIKRVLKPNGVLILTTPNVARLENVARLIAGKNIYDPYSGYGAYGRHNREYTVNELSTLLSFEGFKVDELFTADVHQNNASSYTSLNDLDNLINKGSHNYNLGQYIFVKATNTRESTSKFPSWLYRSLPENLLD